jgi:hypothetical protein
MKAKLITVFITTLIFSGIIIYELVSLLALDKIEAPFDQMVNFIYVIPLAIAAVVTNLANKFSTKITGDKIWLK